MIDVKQSILSNALIIELLKCGFILKGNGDDTVSIYHPENIPHVSSECGTASITTNNSR